MQRLLWSGAMPPPGGHLPDGGPVGRGPGLWVSLEALAAGKASQRPSAPPVGGRYTLKSPTGEPDMGHKAHGRDGGGAPSLARPRAEAGLNPPCPRRR